MGHLPLFIEEVCGRFGGKIMEVCFILVSDSKHALDGLGETWNTCVLTLIAHTTLSWSLSLS